jgi:hypothetical protein
MAALILNELSDNRDGTQPAKKQTKRPSAMKNTYSLLLPGLLLFGSLRVFGAQISTDYDHSTNFSQYKTYSWLKVKAGDSLLEDRIEQDVDIELAAKGWTRVDSNGDASVSAFQSTQDQRTLETFYNSFGGGWRWRGFGDSISTTTTDVTKSGTVIVDIFDSHTQKLIWRGKDSDALSGDPAKNEKKLAKDLTGMLKHFPPSHGQSVS